MGDVYEIIMLAEIKEGSGANGTHDVQKDIEGKRLCSVGCYHT